MSARRPRAVPDRRRNLASFGYERGGALPHHLAGGRQRERPDAAVEQLHANPRLEISYCLRYSRLRQGEFLGGQGHGTHIANTEKSFKGVEIEG